MRSMSIGVVARLPPDICYHECICHDASLTGDFTALVGFEPGSPDSEFDTLFTRPPRRDSRVVLVDPFVFFPRRTGIKV